MQRLPGARLDQAGSGLNTPCYNLIKILSELEKMLAILNKMLYNRYSMIVCWHVWTDRATIKGVGQHL
jgi:hypothetical protein